MTPYVAAMQRSGLAYPSPAYAPPPPPPSVWQTYRQVLAANQEQNTPLQSAVAGVRHNLESALVGALLGAIHGKLGTLDIAGKYPADGIAALVLYVLSVREAGKPDGFAADLRTMSQSCTSVAFFRKTDAWVKKPAATDNVSSKKSNSILEMGREFDL
jgi:hypothetical protein